MLTGMALTLLLGATACGHKKSAESAANQLMSVDVARPEIDSVMLYRSYPATTESMTSADIVGRVNGTLLTRNFTAGDIVQKGQVLFTIEPTAYRDAVQQSRAALATAKSEYTYASNQAAAMRKALESDAVSKLDVIQAESNLESAAAAIKNAEAQLNLALTNLSYCTVRAPFTGHITLSTVDPGSYVSGQGAPFKLATVYGDAVISIDFSMSDIQYQELIESTGGLTSPLFRNVPMTFDTNLGRDYTCDINYQSPVVNTTTGTVNLKASIDNPKYELRPGMYVTLHVPFGSQSNAILVKDSAIGTDQLGKYLYTVNDSNRVVYTSIEVGDLYRDSMRIVTKGLTPESRYVTSAMLKVRDGMPVNPVDKSAKPVAKK